MKKTESVRHFIHLAYLGAPYHGWQVQPGEVSVQGEIERALGIVLRREVSITGAGRTDTGVNARMMIAHVDLSDEEAARTDSICRSIAGILQPHIAIYAIRAVHEGAHARFDATERTYRYYVRTSPSPFETRLAWLTTPTLDFDAMNDAAQYLIGTHDFTSFAKLHGDAKTNICTVTRAQWTQVEPHKWVFEISANRFLRNMVRAVVGTLVEVGRHKLLPSDIPGVLERLDRRCAGTSMPGYALYLWDIKYPYVF